MTLATSAIVRNIPVDENGDSVGPQKNNFFVASGSTVMDEIVNIPSNSGVIAVKVHFSGAVSASQSFTVKEDATGQKFVNHPMATETDYAATYGPSYPVKSGAVLRAQFQNTDLLTWTLEIVWRKEG